ncbi:MAG: hypothetical protein QGG42_21450 [Phycisphaerae bacterium]|nr:hypothetical protein [Phycisphaerae bacterium]
MKRKATILVVICAMVLVWGGQVGAAAPKAAAGDGGQVTLSWDQFVKITGYDPTKKGGQVITVKWAEIEKLLDVKKIDRVGAAATVDLPWTEFRALLEYSVKKGKPGSPPPADYVVTSGAYDGVLTEKGAAFTAVIEINILREKGWKRIPVLPATVALRSSKLPEGVHLNVQGSSYELLTEKTGKIPVELVFEVAVTKSGGTNSVTFTRTLPGSSVVKLTVDGDKVDVKVSGAQSLSVNAAQGKTAVAAALPTGKPVQVTWERAIPKAPAAPTKLYAETATLVSVADGLLLCQESVYFNILHTPVRELKLTVPKGASVLTVTGPGLQDWRVDKDGVLSATLSRETIGSYALQIAYEQAAAAQASAPVPVIRASGVEREKGFVAVVALANVEIEAGKVVGATAIDANRLPGTLTAMTNQPILLGFRYVGKTIDIPLNIRRHGEVSVLATVADSVVFTGMQLSDGRRMTKATYSVRNNRRQFLRMAMPVGTEIWSVSVAGKAATPGKDTEGKVLIPLVRSKSGSSELAAFPVTVVYVHTPGEGKTAPASGTLRVDLPVCEVPVMHVMYNLYLPAEGRYTKGWGASAFSGPVNVVEDFASMSTSAGAAVVARKPSQEAAQMQKRFNKRVDAQARAAGATPIRVSLPVKGTHFKLQKILALPGDKLWFEVGYSGWKVAR